MLKFGLLWTSLIAVMTFFIYGTSGGTYYLNNVPVPESFFKAALMPKVLIGTFWVIGLYMIYLGIKDVLRDIKTDKEGIETCAYIVDLYPSGTYLNGRPEYNIDAMLVDMNTGDVKVITESVGFTPVDCVPGTYVNVKWHENDINVIGPASEYDVSFTLEEEVKKRFGKIDSSNSNEGSVVIDGVEYVRKDTLKG